MEKKKEIMNEIMKEEEKDVEKSTNELWIMVCDYVIEESLVLKKKTKNGKNYII